MNRFARFFLLFLCAALVAFATSSVRAEKGDVSQHPMIGEQAPPFELTSISGDTMSLAGWKGKYLVLHFGASW